MNNKQNFFLVLLQGINVVRLVIINIVFFVLLFVVLAVLAGLSESKDEVRKLNYGTILDVSPKGIIIEKENEYEWMEALFSERKRYSMLKDITNAIYEAASDERIEAIYFDFSYLHGISSSHLAEIEAALKVFKETEKPIWAYSSSYGMSDYYIASFAKRIGLDPLGDVSIPGFASESLYFKGMEEKFGIKFQTFKAGECKGAVEAFSRDSMSKEVRENLSSMLFDMWGYYLKKVAKNTEKTEEEIKYFSENPYELLSKYNGNEAKMALGYGMITDMMTMSEFKEKMKDELSDSTGDDLSFVPYIDYVKTLKKREYSNKIGVIYLTGSITSSKRSNTADVAVASEITALFNKAMRNNDIKAIVLRVDSGGGEVFASELMRRALREARDKYNKPIVVSMGSVAASGAYWISSSADYIFASPFTITGSIGVLAMLPNFQNLLKEKLGITSDRVGVMEGGYSAFSPLTNEQKAKMQLGIDATYDMFLHTVATGRNMKKADVELIAEGRVYSGEQAKNLGLVDEVGTFNDAIEKAAKLSNIEDFSVEEVVEPLTPMNQFIKTILEKDGGYRDIKLLKTIGEFLSLENDKGIYVYTPQRLMWVK
ncbi:MAG: signal peptide peptidase SppA [Treponema sp.]